MSTQLRVNIKNKVYSNKNICWYRYMITAMANFSEEISHYNIGLMQIFLEFFTTIY